jgi:hypothetical protein
MRALICAHESGPGGGGSLGSGGGGGGGGCIAVGIEPDPHALDDAAVLVIDLLSFGAGCCFMVGGIVDAAASWQPPRGG